MKMFVMDTDHYVLDINPEALKIKEFSEIVKRDKTKFKTVAQAELAFVWFFCDFKSDFLQIIDDEERKQEIIQSIDGLTKGWEPDDLIMAAIDRYKSLSRTVTSRMLDDAREILDNMSEYAKTASKNLDTNDMSKIQKYISDLPKMIATLNTLEESVLRDKESTQSHRGSQEKGLMEDDDE